MPDPSHLMRLHTQLIVVCPIDGISIGRWGDKTTWRVDYRPEATDSQKTAAQVVIADFDPDAPVPPSSFATAIDKLVARVSPPVDPDLKAIFVEWRKQIS